MRVNGLNGVNNSLLYLMPVRSVGDRAAAGG